MCYLLDTHTILWYLQDDENLSMTARSIIDKEDCFYSKVSLWEIAIKQSIGKLRYNVSIPEIERLCRNENFMEVPVTSNEIENLKVLPFIHNDPFDRLLISLAQSKNMTLITRDTIIPKYPIRTLW